MFPPEFRSPAPTDRHPTLNPRNSSIHAGQPFERKEKGGRGARASQREREQQAGARDRPVRRAGGRRRSEWDAAIFGPVISALVAARAYFRTPYLERSRPSGFVALDARERHPLSAADLALPGGYVCGGRGDCFCADARGFSLAGVVLRLGLVLWCLREFFFREIEWGRRAFFYWVSDLEGGWNTRGGTKGKVEVWNLHRLPVFSEINENQLFLAHNWTIFLRLLGRSW